MNNILEHFYNSVNLYPNKTAIYKEHDSFITYKDLNILSSIIASFYLNKYTKKKIIIYGDSSLEYYIVLLAVIKSNNIFINIDKSLPSKRKDILFEISKSDLVINLTKEKLNFDVDQINYNEINFDNYLKNDFDDFKRDFNSAYIYFTSGTTGLPKGVLGRHDSLEHFINWMTNTFQLTENNNIAQLTNLSFDVSLREIFLSLSIGGTLYLIDPINKRDTKYLVNWIDKHKISLINIVPTYAENILDVFSENNLIELKHLKFIFFAGEPLSIKMVNKWREIIHGNYKMVNFYGPTETTMAKCFYILPQKLDNNLNIVPIGFPISETKIFILKEDGSLSNKLEEGEICIDTKYPTYGYINSETELLMPYKSYDSITNKVYKTGDIGFLNSNDEIEIVGRKDDQIKISGVRINLNEINHYINKFDKIHKGLCLFDKERRILEMFYVLKKEYLDDDLQEIELEIKLFLLNYLPHNLLPHYYYKVSEFKFNSNGKLDRPFLYENTRKEELNEMSFEITEIVKSVLRVDEILTNENLFEYGLTSLKCIQIGKRIYDKYDTLIHFQEILINPYLNVIVDLLKKQLNECQIDLKEIDYEMELNLSPQQNRFLNIYLPNGINRSWSNQISKIDFDLVYKEEIFHEVIYNIINNNDTFKIYFTTSENNNEKVRFKDVSSNDVKFDFFDFTGYSEKDLIHYSDIVYNFMANKIIDHHNWPLYNFTVIKKDCGFTLYFVIHHLIFDGTSVGIFHNLIKKNYQNKYLNYNYNLKETDKSSYNDYLLNNKLEKELLNINKEYWNELFNGFNKTFSLKKSENKLNNNFLGSSKKFKIDFDTYKSILDISSKQKATIYEILLFSYTLSISKIFNKNEIVISYPSVGRRNVFNNNSMGNYINIVSIRVNKINETPIESLFNNIKNQIRNSVIHENYQFDELINDLNIVVENDMMPLSTLLFNIEKKEESINDIKLSKEIEMGKDVRYEIMVNLSEYLDGILIDFQFVKSLFESSIFDFIFEDMMLRLNSKVFLEMDCLNTQLIDVNI